MILDTLDHLAQLERLGGAFADAARFLRDPGLSDLEPARVEVGGRGAYATIVCVPARRAAEGRLEAHRRFADIQVLLGGQETIGWRPLAACAAAAGPYDPETDLQFFTDEPQAWLPLRPGQFAVFFPGDAHLPLVGEGRLSKVVVKVPLADDDPAAPR